MIKPWEGNGFVHVFDGNGRVEHTEDEEGGRWEFSRVTDAAGNITYETKALAEGDDVYNITSYGDRTDSTGKHTSEITGPAGGMTQFTRSSDSLGVVKELPCGTELGFEYDADPRWQTKYVKK